MIVTNEGTFELQVTLLSKMSIHGENMTSHDTNQLFPTEKILLLLKQHYNKTLLLC